MITNSITDPAAARSPTASSSAVSSQTTDSNQFMTLLVAQLKNQDPMEPQDSTAFVAQLAQFNSLDQLIAMRHAMEQLVTSINGTSANPSQQI